jgi:hypothetical protein
MKDLIDLVENGIKDADGKVSYPTQEMVYDIVVILGVMNQAGISVDGSVSITALETWQGMSHMNVIKADGKTVEFKDFINEAPKVTSGNLSADVQTFVLDNVYTSYMDKLGELGDATQMTNEILQALTQLLDLANNLKTSDVGTFNFPPDNAEDIKTLYDTYATFFSQLTDKDGKPRPYTGTNTAYKGGSWSNAFNNAYTTDSIAASKLMDNNPGMTYDEAMSQQHASSDLVKEFLNDKNTKESDVNTLLESLKTEVFSVSLEASGVNLVDSANQVLALKNQLKELLNELSPGGAPYETNSLSFFLDKVIQDIDGAFGQPPYNDDGLATSFTNWMQDIASPGSTTYYNLNQAINSAKYMNNQQKQDLQTAMMTFQSLMKMGISMMEDMSKTIQSLASKVSGR